MMVCCYVCCYVSGGVCVLDLYCYLVLMFGLVGFVVLAVLCSVCICYLLLIYCLVLDCLIGLVWVCN